MQELPHCTKESAVVCRAVPLVETSRVARGCAIRFCGCVAGFDSKSELQRTLYHVSGGEIELCVTMFTPCTRVLARLPGT